MHVWVFWSSSETPAVPKGFHSRWIVCLGHLPRPERGSGETDYSQYRFGHPELAQIHCWPLHFWPIHLDLVCLKVGTGRVGPRGWGPKPRDKWDPEEWGPPNRVFFRLPPPIRSFCVSLGVFSWNFGGFFEAPGRSNVHVWSSRVVV